VQSALQELVLTAKNIGELAMGKKTYQSSKVCVYIPPKIQIPENAGTIDIKRG
jgi:hypothetical protein